MRQRAAGVGVMLVMGFPLITTACTSETPTSTPPAVPTAQPTPLTAYDTSDVAIQRAPFCDRVSPTGIEHALGGPAAHHAEWDNGDSSPVGDRGEEYGCSWTRKRTVARAWVFAPPVTAGQARGYAAEESGPSCHRLQDQPTFGSPGLAMSCSLQTGGTLVRFAGLFGDAWVSCEVQADTADPQLVDRAGTWCVTALAAARI